MSADKVKANDKFIIHNEYAYPFSYEILSALLQGVRVNYTYNNHDKCYYPEIKYHSYPQIISSNNFSATPVKSKKEELENEIETFTKKLETLREELSNLSSY